jgi:dUTP pyrophosphatase
MKLKFKRMSDLVPVPKYQTAGAAGFDLHALGTYHISPGETVTVHTGLKVEVPEGYELQVRPRSGVSRDTSLRIANAPGTIDSDYRGEIMILITNISKEDDELVVTGSRIAQGVLAPITRAEFEETKELSETERGAAAFGSTGR